jgi:acetate kinase
MYAYKVKKFIGAYIAAINGCDILVFTGGVGENDFNLRKMVCRNMEFLGIDFDVETNHNKKGVDQIISTPDSKVTVMTLTTDEELVIASDTKRLVDQL